MAYLQDQDEAVVLPRRSAKALLHVVNEGLGILHVELGLLLPVLRLRPRLPHASSWARNGGIGVRVGWCHSLDLACALLVPIALALLVLPPFGLLRLLLLLHLLHALELRLANQRQQRVCQLTLVVRHCMADGPTVLAQQAGHVPVAERDQGRCADQL